MNVRNVGKHRVFPVSLKTKTIHMSKKPDASKKVVKTSRFISFVCVCVCVTRLLLL